MIAQATQPVETIKTCSRCRLPKPLSSFDYFQHRGKWCYRARCRDCNNELRRVSATLVCPHCIEEKPRAKFVKCGQTRQADGRKEWCLKCQIDASTRVCTRCRFEGEKDDHFFVNRRKKNGYHHWCKSCMMASHKPYAKSEAGKRSMLKSRMMRKFGMSLDDYDEMLAKQGGCAICGAQSPGGRGRRFHIDHCHIHGFVRGLLCHSCNTAIGLLNDDPERMIAAAEYLRGQCPGTHS